MKGRKEMSKSKKATKTIAIILSLLLAVSLFSACGSSDSGGGNSSGGGTGSSDSGGNSGGSGTSSSGGTEESDPFANLPQVTWRFGTISSIQVIGVQTLWIAEQVAERTNGKFILDTYLNGVLGNTTVMCDSVQGGLLEMAQIPASVVANYVTEIGFWALPYLITDWDTAIAVSVSDLFDRYDSAFEANGFYSGGFYVNGFRQVANNVRPITCLADFAGIKLRVMDSPIYLDIFNTFGAYAVTMAASELPTGLQQGVVDGNENPPETLYNQFYEFTDYLSITNHICYMGMVVMNADAVNSLPPEYKAVLDEVLAESNLIHGNLVREEEAGYIQAMQDSGKIEINYLSDEAINELAEFSKAQIWPKYEAEYGSIMNEIANFKP